MEIFSFTTKTSNQHIVPPLANSKSGDQTNMASTLETTTVTYHIDDEDIPCQGKISKTPSEITLGDFKKIIPQKYHKHKFFFKNKDDEFGIVKQEITDDNANLPLFDGRIVSWLVATEGNIICLVKNVLLQVIIHQNYSFFH